MKFARFTLALACVVTAATASAVDESALRACRAVADDARRLACYDRAVERADVAPREAAPDPGAAPVAAAPDPAPAEPPAQMTPEERFGRRGAMTREEVERKEQETRELGELEATVTDIETRIDGLMTITLDNGQVWRQSRPDSQFRLKTGDRIKIAPGVLNSYILSGPSKRSTRVTRVR